MVPSSSSPTPRHAFSTSAIALKRVFFAVKRNFEEEELRKPKNPRPNSRQRRLKPPRPPIQHLDTVLRGRTSQKHVTPDAFPPLEGGTRAALTLLRSQPELYAVIAMQQARHIVTPGDLLTVYNLRDTRVGDVIRFTRIEEVGSRDYTLRLQRPLPQEARQAQYFTPEAVSLCGVVVEHTRSKVRYTWRRGYHYRHLRAHVNHVTRIRIGRIDLGRGLGAAEEKAEAMKPVDPIYAQTWCVSILLPGAC